MFFFCEKKLSIKTLDPDPELDTEQDPHLDPHLPKMLDPEPH
jgi:hypothetical protein